MSPVHIKLMSVAQTESNISEHLKTIYCAIAARYPSIDRVALATYDGGTDTLKTFVSSSKDGVLLDHYEAKLANVPTLRTIAQNRQIRVVDDIDQEFISPSQHTAWLKSRAYRSSLTVPIFLGNTLAGFLFFDSKEAGSFDPDMTEFLKLFANLISQLYLLQLQVVHGMVGSVHIASGLARIRDLETGAHLDRMAAYSRLIARKLAQSHQLSDEFIEYVFLFAPLHDVGKVGVPDKVLLKPGKLDADEWVLMRRHVEIGESIVVQMGLDLGLGKSMAFDIMRNIVACHHERGDGSGYPRGHHMAEIPMEARIVAVADVYDALSNNRPYKKAWTEEAIVAEMQKEAACGRLDPDCVDALLGLQSERQDIMQRCSDEAG
jgi:HD-GYP domain-containing protein (c-di-GMP phosphodiesterase class II)